MKTYFFGGPVGGAKIRYRVVRQVRYPDWWYWCFAWRMPNSGSQEIAHGTAESGADGTFKIQFVAKPDLLAFLEANGIVPGAVAEVLCTLEEAAQRRVIRSVLTGRRLAYVGALAAPAAAIVAVTVVHRGRLRRLRPVVLS